MHAQSYIGIDLGSSSIKAVALNDAGQCIATASRAQPIDTGPGGKAEQSPATWRQLAGECLTQLTSDLAHKSFQPAAIAATGQMNAPVLLDANLESLGPVQMWCDSRCGPQCEILTTRLTAEHLLEITGHTAVTGYTAPKLLWIADHEPDKLDQVAHVVFPKDFITKTLTGNIVTDYSDASNSLLLDVRNAQWDPHIAKAVGLQHLQLPLLANSKDIVGQVSADAASWSGLPLGLPVAAGAGDSIAVALGAGLSGPDQIQIVIGTAGNVNCVLDNIAIDHAGRVHTGFFVDNEHWICSGVQQSSGTSLRWWSKITGRPPQKLLDEAGTANRVHNVVFAPYLAGERTPHLDPHVRGVFAGLDQHSSRSDMTRAILEGVAFSFKDAVEVFARMGIEPARTVICGGGADSDLWCQIIASVLGLSLQRTTGDATARGAAMLAACAAGRFESWQDAATHWYSGADRFAPLIQDVQRYRQGYQQFEKLYPAVSKILSC